MDTTSQSIWAGKRPSEEALIPVNASASVRTIEQTVLREKEKHQKQLRAQQQTIERLQQENLTLRDKLEIDSRLPSGSTSVTLAQEIQDLERTIGSMTGKIGGLREELDMKDKELSILNSKIAAKRVEVGGVYSSRESDQVVQKQIRILENRLEKALVKFNEAIASNKTLREQIDNLRCERVIFDGIYKKTERDLYDRKKEMARIIEDSNLAYEERNASIEELRQLQEQQRESRDAFKKEMDRLEREIAKGNERSQLNQLRDRDLSASAFGAPPEPAEGSVAPSQAPSRSRQASGDGGWSSMKQRTVQQLSNEKVQTYEDALKQIQAATKITDINELVHHFIEIEDMNVSNANMIGDIEIETQKVRAKTKELRTEEENRRKAYSATNEECRKRTAALLERLTASEHRRDEYVTRTKECFQWLEAAAGPILELFNEIGCKLPEGELGPPTITRENVMRFLGLIEQRIVELVAPYVVLHPEMRHLLGHVAERADADEGGIVFPSTNKDDEELEVDVPLIGADLRSTALTLVQRQTTSAASSLSRTSPSRRRSSEHRLGSAGSSRQRIAELGASSSALASSPARASATSLGAAAASSPTAPPS